MTVCQRDRSPQQASVGTYRRRPDVAMAVLAAATSAVRACPGYMGGVDQRMSRRRGMRRSAMAAVVSVFVLTSSAGSSLAAAPRFNPPKSYYLALGDSFSF